MKSDSNEIFREEVITKVIYICSKDKYALITDFKWLIRVYVTIAMVPTSSGSISRNNSTRNLADAIGYLLSESIVEIALRVESIRPYLIQQMMSLISVYRRRNLVSLKNHTALVSIQCGLCIVVLTIIVVE